MATNLLVSRPAGIRACATQKPDPNSSRRSSPGWWSPLFGWSSEPDYIDPSTPNDKAERKIGSGSDAKQSRSPSRFVPVCFTEEKARLLRMLTTETSSFHDAMYHSAIASRLASDFKKRPVL